MDGVGWAGAVQAQEGMEMAARGCCLNLSPAPVPENLTWTIQICASSIASSMAAFLAQRIQLKDAIRI